MKRYLLILLLLLLSINFINSQDIKDNTNDSELSDKIKENEITVIKDPTTDVIIDDETSNIKEEITKEKDTTTDKEEISNTKDLTDDTEKKDTKKKKKKFIFIKNKNKPIIFKNQIYIYNFNTLNKIGIIFCPTGVSLMLAGTALFLYDYFGYIKTLEKSSNYDEYMTNYTIDIALLASGISSMGIGLCLFIISIPFIIYKKENKEISFYINPGIKTSFGLSYKFY